jgi:hypothetical protein
MCILAPLTGSKHLIAAAGDSVRSAAHPLSEVGSSWAELVLNLAAAGDSVRSAARLLSADVHPRTLHGFQSTSAKLKHLNLAAAGDSVRECRTPPFGGWPCNVIRCGVGLSCGWCTLKEQLT